MPQSTLRILNWISATLLIGCLLLLLMNTANTLARRSRVQNYLSYAKSWSEAQHPSSTQQASVSSPWGGAYRVVEKLPGYDSRALLITGFPPESPAQFSDLEREYLQKAWQNQTIPKTKLIFHFNGLPALVLEP